VIDSVFSFDHDHEHEKERMTDKPCHRRNVAYNFQSACEKRRPVAAMSAAAVRQKCFVRQQWRARKCGEINTAWRFTSRLAGQEL
jgi:hypothetical protein